MDEIEKTFKTKVLDQFKKPVNLLLIGLFVGAFTIIGLRLILIKDTATHYHANFALYINGQKDTFNNFTFYEEVAGCSADEHNNPKHRGHMHDQDNSVVHVHDDAVTWGDFFANLGYGITNNLVKTDAGAYIDGAEGKKLTFILNGEKITTIANKVIGDKDILLVDYNGATNIQKEYDAIPRTAEEHDRTPDPASCSGTIKLSFGERLKRAFDFSK